MKMTKLYTPRIYSCVANQIRRISADLRESENEIIESILSRYVDVADIRENLAKSFQYLPKKISEPQILGFRLKEYNAKIVDESIAYSTLTMKAFVVLALCYGIHNYYSLSNLQTKGETHGRLY